MSSEVNIQQTEKKKRDKKKLLLILSLIVCAGIAVTFLALYKGGEDRTAWLKKKLESASEATIEIDKNIIITEPIAISGNKTLTGEGTIVYKPNSAEKIKLESYRIPDEECQALDIADLSETSAMFEVPNGSSLTIAGSLTVDTNNKALGVKVEEEGTVVISESATLKNGLGANILSEGDVTISGGSVQSGDGYNVMSYGTMSVKDGEVAGSGKRLMNIVVSGALDVEGGKISGAEGTNIYLLDGKVSVSGGTIDGAKIDNVYVKAGELGVTGGTISQGKHGVHNTGTTAVTGGTYDNNTNSVYNEGIIALSGLNFGNSQGHNIYNTGKTAQMEMTDVVIESATSHGVYNACGAKLDAKDLTVKATLAQGVHNGGGYFTGENITIVRAGATGVGNEVEKGWTGEGEITIDGLKVMSAGKYNLLNSSGTMTLTDVELGLITTHSVYVSGGTLNLTDTEIKGTTGKSTAHVFYLLNGTINTENVNIEKTVARAIMNRGGEFNGKSLTISNVGGTAVGNQIGLDGVSSGAISIDGLEITDCTGYCIQNTCEGSIDITNANVEVTRNTAVRIDSGSITLTGVEFNGKDIKEDESFNGVTAMGGSLTLKNVSFEDMLGRAVYNNGATIKGTDVAVNGTSGGGIVTKTGSTTLNKVTTKNVTGYNVDVQDGTVAITDSTLNESKNANVCVQGGTLTLTNVLVNGSPKVTKADGSIKNYDGILAKAGKVILKDVTVQDAAGRGLNCMGAKTTGENVKVLNSGGTAVYNSDGNLSVSKLEVSGSTGYNIDVASGSAIFDNSVLRESKIHSVHVADGTMTLKNTLVDGAPAITDKDGKVKNYNGIGAEGGTVNLDTVTIRNTAGRSISNTGATLTGKNVVLENAGGTSLYNSGTVTIDGLEITKHEEAGAYNIDNSGTLTVKNATLCKSGTSSIYLREKSSTTLEKVVVEGTTKSHSIYIKESATLNFDTLTVNNSKSRAITNGDADKKVKGGTINGKNLVIDTTGGTAIANISGKVVIDGAEISNSKGYNVDVQAGNVTLSNADLHETKTHNVNITDGILTLNDAVVDGAPSITDEEGNTKNYNGIAAAGGTVNLNTVTIQNTAARGLSNTGATVNGKKVVVANAGGTSFYNKGIATIDGLEITEHEDVAAFNIDNYGTLTVKNANLCKSGTYNVCLQEKSGTTFEKVVVEGTTKDHSIYVKKDATLDFDTLTINNSKGRALTNGDASKTPKMEGGTVVGKTLTVDTTGTGGVVNYEGILKIDGLSMNSIAGYGLDNSATMELKNVNISGCQYQSINNTGDVTVDGGTINNTTNYPGIRSKKGSVTLAGTVHITTANTNAITLDDATDAEALILREGATLVTSKIVNLPANHAIKVLGQLGNASEQKIQIGPTVADAGTVFVKTPSEALATELIAKDIFEVSGSGIVAEEANLVAADFDERETVVSVTTWSALKNAIETAEENSNLRIVVKGDIASTDEGAINHGASGKVKVTLTTDVEEGVTITRTDLTKALLNVSTGSVMLIDGKITLDGNSNSTTKASEALVLNKGTLTINNGVTIKNCYKEASTNSVGYDTSTGSAGAIESVGTLNLNGTVTTSNSGNGTAVMFAGGTFTADGAKINNGGRAMRIYQGIVTLTNVEVNNNTAGGGAGVLIDGGTVTMNNCNIHDNTSTGSGGGIKAQSLANLTMNGCTVKDNTDSSTGGGGGIRLSGSATLAMNASRIESNDSFYITSNSDENYSGYGGGIRTTATGKITIKDNCYIGDNTAEVDGGGICAAGTGKIEVISSSISNNEAVNGGGICVTSSGKIELTSCTISVNITTNKGGGIYVSGSGDIDLTTCQITSNEAKNGGAFNINHASAIVTVIGGSISSNEVTQRGGVSLVDKGTLKITGCKIENNDADKDSGVLFVNTDGSAELISCEMNGNGKSSGNPKVIRMKGTLTLTGCTIDNVSTKASGMVGTSDTYPIYHQSGTLNNNEN